MKIERVERAIGKPVVTFESENWECSIYPEHRCVQISLGNNLENMIDLYPADIPQLMALMQAARKELIRGTGVHLENILIDHDSPITRTKIKEGPVLMILAAKDWSCSIEHESGVLKLTLTDDGQQMLLFAPQDAEEISTLLHVVQKEFA